MQKANEVKNGFRVSARRYLPVICLLVLGVAVSFVMFLLVHNWEEANQRSEFESWAKAYTNSVESTLNEYVGALMFLGDFFDNSSFVTRQEFTSLVKSVLRRYPGIQAFGWDPLVKDDERTIYESAARKDGFDDFEFTERSETNELVRAARREEYVVVYYIHPLEGNRPAFGFDIASNRTRLKAITKAFDTGKLSVTGRITLVQETGSQFGVLILLPIYHQGTPLNTPEERRKNRKGFAVEVLRIGQAVETALKSFSDEGICLTLYDMSANEENRFLYHRPSRMSKTKHQPMPAEEIQKGLFWSKTIDLAERRWKIILSASDFYYQSRKMWQAWIVLFGSLLLTSLLAFYMLRKILYTIEIEQRVKKQAQTNKQLENEIRERTKAEEELKRSEERFRNTFEQAAVGIAHVGLDGTWLRVNKRLCDIVGYSREEFMRLTFQDITYPDDLGTDLGYFRQMLKGEIQTYAMEKRYIRKNGSLAWINLTVSLARHMSGKPSHFISVIEDISARRDAEKAQQAHLQLLKGMEQIDQVVRTATDLGRMMSDVLDAVLSIFDCDRAFLLYPCDPDSPSWRVPMERTVPEYPGAEVLKREIPMEPWVAEILQRVIESDGAVKFGPQEENPVPSEGRALFQIQSIIAMTVYPKENKPWMFGLHQCSFPRIWSAEENTLFQEIGRRIADSLTSLQAYHNLQKSEERFRTLVENIPGFVYRSELKDPWGLYYVSESALDLTGYPARDFVENRAIDFGKLIMPEDLPMVEGVVDQGIKEHAPFEITYRIRHASGDIKWVHEKGRATYDEDGTPVWLDGVIEDISERKQAQQQRKESELKLKEAQKMARLGYWKWDIKTGHCEWSDETYRIFRLDPKVFTPQIDSIMALSPWPGDNQREQEIIREAIEKREQGSFEQRFLRPDGTIGHYFSTFRGIFDENDELITMMGTVQDITERKQIESELQEFADTQAVLLSEVNHRVKNNLMVIVSMLHKERDRAAEKEAAHSVSLINDMLGRIEGLSTVHSMLSSVGWQPLDLSQLCEQVIKEVLKAHKIDAELNISPSDVQVDSDQAHHLTLVINELATNSIKYALPEGPRICIAVEIEGFEDTISVTFKDNGPGFPEDIISGEYSGSSLGLDLINGIVNKSLNGSISFRNQGGAVAVMTFEGAVCH